MLGIGRRNNLSNNQPLSLKDLLNVKKWQKIQDNFSVVAGVSIRTVDSEGAPVTSPSREPRLCRELLKDSPAKSRACGSCLPTFLGGKGIVDKNLSFVCQAGVHNFSAPLKVDEQVFGYVILGPVILVMRKSKEEYRKAAEELNLDLEDFWSAILEIKVTSFSGIQSLVELIKDVGEYNLTSAYKNKLKQKEAVMAPGSPKFTRLLNALLDVAFEITGADIGSVMVYDKSSKELSIHVSRGIAEEIVKSAKVKLGSGISGIAAKEGRSFLLDENTTDNRIRSYFNRPNISSSMVIPLKAENRVVGVMNLGALVTSSVRFNNDNINLMNKLADLATVAVPV